MTLRSVLFQLRTHLWGCSRLNFVLNEGLGLRGAKFMLTESCCGVRFTWDKRRKQQVTGTKYTMQTVCAIAAKRQSFWATVFREHSRRSRIPFGSWREEFGKFRRRHSRCGNSMSPGVSMCLCVCVSGYLVNAQERAGLAGSNKREGIGCKLWGHALSFQVDGLHRVLTLHTFWNQSTLLLCVYYSLMYVLPAPRKYFNLMLQKPLPLSRIKLSAVKMTIALRHMGFGMSKDTKALA